MEIIYPKNEHNVYFVLPEGIYDLVVTWNGAASVDVKHMTDRTWETVRTAGSIPAGNGQRRLLVRLASEKPQQVHFTANGAEEATARLSAQAIPATIEVTL